MNYRLINADVMDGLRELADESVQCVITSPPYYGLRDYGIKGQLGLERTPEGYIAKMVTVFREVRRVLRKDGVLWLNIGDSYAGSGRGGNPETGTKQGTNAGSQTIGVLYGREQEAANKERERIRDQFAAQKQNGIKPKDLIGIPWMLAFALRADGWYLRSEIIWAKGISFCSGYSGSVMPESVRDRPTKAHEQIFLLTRSRRYFYDADAIAEESIWKDPRRPYGSEGAWQMDGRPAEQRHGGKLREGAKRGAFGGKYGAQECDESFRAVVERRNLRDVWAISPEPFREAHFATFPTALVEPCILAGSSPTACGECGAPWKRITAADWRRPTCDHIDDSGRCTVLDPFSGSGTTGVVALGLQRNYVGIDLNGEYVEMSRRRLSAVAPMFAKEESTTEGAA